MSKEALKLAQEGVEIHAPNSPEYIVCAALIKALAQPEPVALPDDFELLPVDPTPEMKSAAVEVELFDSDTGKDYVLSWEEAEQIYSAMLNAAPTPPQPKEPEQEPVRLRRGDILRCIETDELCTVWATSTTGKTLVKWSANNFGTYTKEQIGELFWLETELDDLELAAEKSDNYASFHAGYRFAVAHPSAQPEEEPVAIPRFGLNPDNGMMYESKRRLWCLFKDIPPQPNVDAGDISSERVDKTDENVHEPVGSLSVRYHHGCKSMTNTDFDYNGDLPEGDYELYAHPPQRTWVGLTDDDEIPWDGVDAKSFAQAIEAKLKEKNT